MTQIDILIRSNRRSLSISIDPQCQVIVKAPRNLPLSKIQYFVDSKSDWIMTQKNKIYTNFKLNENLFNYSKILFCGNLFNILYDKQSKQITLNEDYLLVPQKYADKTIKKISQWYKSIAIDVLINRTKYFCTLMQLNPSEIKLTNAKRCWGICNSNAVVSLNWRLIMLPHNLIDYVIVHELAHLVQLNHSKLFWEVVKSVIPDYNTRRKDLHKGDFLLSLFRESRE